mgnify:CR=1 FL=1
MKNPFSAKDPDRHAIWEMLVERDIAAFVAQDWDRVAGDFLEEGFFGLNGGLRANPDGWSIAFPSLSHYRDEWLKQAGLFAGSHAEADPGAAIHRLTTLRDIEIEGDKAVAHKKFDGIIALQNGGKDFLRWQTLYHCRKVEGRWRISGFTGYLPNPMGSPEVPSSGATSHPKQLPAGAAQHATAGPYSPVLEITPEKLVVISGQAALDSAGNVVGETIEEQTRLTLENCFTQLATANCTPADVFKVNIFMTDLDEWPRLNAVYKEMMPEPQPVRTAVQSGLLFTLKVEIEMWAVRR